MTRRLFLAAINAVPGLRLIVPAQRESLRPSEKPHRLSLPNGWKWFEMSDGRRVFQDYGSDGKPLPEYRAFAYDPTDMELMTTGFFDAAERRGTAKIFKFSREGVPLSED
jgi:hypothetical protein